LSASLEEDSPFLPAVLLTDVKPEMAVMADEIFGPVVALVPFTTDEEALSIANACSYGLTASVWSRNRNRARAIASRIDAGAVMINDHLMSHGLAETPWGGFKDSGLGRTHGRDGFREMVRTQVIVEDLLPGVKKNLWWHPYSRKVYLGIRAIIDLQFAPSLRKRLSSALRLIPFFFRYWDKS
jgi:succinate-semialdehyde dehydrogenase/glutarate-semialdehyde dehydrogenase